MSIDIKLPLGPFRDALSTVLGAVLGFLLVSMVAAFVPSLITYWGRVSLNELVFFFFTAWIGHWIIACVPIWGMFFAFFQFIGFHALIYSSRDPVFILGLIFANQAFVSTVALLVINSPDFARPAIGGIATLGLAGFALWKLHANGYSRAII
jgi:hypothetical protein